MSGGLILANRDGTTRRVHAPTRDWSGAIATCAVASALALLAIALGWRGSDLPAQLFRVEWYRQNGLVLWNSQWFSGHATFDYSVLSAVAGAITGPIALCAISGIVSAVLFDRLVHREFGTSARVGSLWFATSTVTNLVVGRVTFSLGLVLALGALLCIQRHRILLALLCALLCPLASPVAGLFLAIAAGAWGFARPSARTLAWTAAALGVGPLLIIAMLFPSPGTQPYELWALGCDLALCTLCWFAVPRRYAALRWGAALYALVLLATYFFASPLGGNVSRLNQYAAGPVLTCALWDRRRALVIVLAVPLLFWQWYPTFDTIGFARSDPSTHTAYYTPLLRYLSAQPNTFGRVEVPATYRHWESAYVAPKFPLARGWERQLDYAYDAQFYDGSLTARSFENWLLQNGVQYVALPDARLDSSSFTEARLLRSGLSYLAPAWGNAHWRVWKFRGYHGLVDGPARLESMTADTFTLRVTGTGVITVHIHDSPRWAVQDAGCTSASPDGWIELHHVDPGEVRVAQALRGTRCGDGDQ